MELTTSFVVGASVLVLFMMSKIQNLNGTHNVLVFSFHCDAVVYDVKDTKFEWNSQHTGGLHIQYFVVYDVKDTKFEWNSQLKVCSSTINICCL